MMPAYTPIEGRVLEDHYIAGYKAEGIWDRYHLKPKPIMRGMEKPPNKREEIRVRQLSEGRERVFKAVKSGCKTVTEVRAIWPKSETAVRRYLQELKRVGRIEPVGQTANGAVIWSAVQKKPSL
jgi:predicted HTH transcriptional regulator